MRRRGTLLSIMFMSLVLGLMAITMASVFTTNLNFSQAALNGDMALHEAEAGLAELMQTMAQDEDYGLAGETVTRTNTPGMRPSEAYHVVTFQSGGGFPHSVNNKAGTATTGYLGRPVPPGRVLVYSTGYCRGQYRTIEAVLEQPPFPYAVAVSGRLDSPTPLRVEGVASFTDFVNGNLNKPGHLACNSNQGMSIASDPNNPTTILGFARSTGPVSVASPSLVRGGLKPMSAPLTLPQVDVTQFDTQNQAGVVTPSQYTFTQDMTLQGVYYFGQNVAYQGKVTMMDSVVYVNGDLHLARGVEGVGALMTTGAITLDAGTPLDPNSPPVVTQSGVSTTLQGMNNVALLSRGPLTINGTDQSHLVQGLVYSETGVVASNITVVGNVVVNNPTPGQGDTTLSNVRIVGNPAASQIRFTSLAGMGSPGSWTGPVPWPPVGTPTDSGFMNQTGNTMWIGPRPAADPALQGWVNYYHQGAALQQSSAASPPVTAQSWGSQFVSTVQAGNPVEF
ncbi:MAG: hypothetical protein AB1758_38060, partial [Candidatus Eremiobacterota bacterium]